jgi:hypothetical protein
VPHAPTAVLASESSRFAFHVDDLPERFVDVIGHDLMAVDVDLVEHCLVELTSP